MRRVTVELRVRDETRQRRWLQQGQVVEIGSSDTADISVPDDPEIAPLHVCLAHQPMGCFAECLAPPSTMLVNGRPYPRKRLKNNDLVCVGQSMLHISIEEESPPPIPLADSPT